VDRQWSNKLECRVAQARRVVTAYGLAGAHREELKDKRWLALRTELRNFRLVRSGMIKMVRGAVATLPTLRGAMQMSNLKMLGTILIFALSGQQSLFAQAAISEPRAYAFYHPDADVPNGGQPAFHSLESTNAFASERDSRIDGHAPRSQSSWGRHRHSFSNDTRELTDISHWK
jgi:hypothetical protein